MGYEFVLGCNSTYVEVDIPLASRIAYGGCVMLLFTKTVYAGITRNKGSMSLMDETIYGPLQEGTKDPVRVVAAMMVSLGQMGFMLSSWNYPVLKATFLVSQLDLQELGTTMVMSLGLATIMANMSRS